MPMFLLMQFVYGTLCPVGLLGSATSLHTVPRDAIVRDSIVMVDIAPDSSQDLPTVLVAEVGKARALGLTLFVDIGGSYCPSCVELHHLLRKKPADAQLLREFAGTYIIALSLDKWPGDVNNLTSIGLPSPIRGIPAFLAIDTKGHSTAILYGDQWGNNDPEGLVPLQHFFQAHMWTSPSSADITRKKHGATNRAVPRRS